MSEKISIVVPAYNVASYIGGCVDSLLNQSYPDLEVIVVDDGSTDGTFDVVKEMTRRDSRLRVYQQPNRGAAAARNMALSKVTGEYVTFVDGDDTLAPNTLAENIVFLQKDTSLDWVAFPVLRVSGKNTKAAHTMDYSGFCPTKNRIIARGEFASAYFKGVLSELCCGSLYRMSAVKLIRFPENEYYEDSFYFNEVLQITQKGMISKDGAYFYLLRDGSSQRAKLDAKRLQSKLNVMKERVSTLAMIDSSCFSFFHDMVSSLYYHFLIENAKNKGVAKDSIEELIRWWGVTPSLSFIQRCKVWILLLFGADRARRLHSWITCLRRRLIR